MVDENNIKTYHSGFTIEYINNDIIYIVFDGTVRVDLTKAKKIRDLVMDIVKNKDFKTIVDFRGVFGVTDQNAREFMSKKEHFNNQKLCDAFITDSFSTNMLIGVYIKVFNPSIPTKTFSSFDEARGWVKNFS